MIATLFSRAGVRKRKNARGCVQSSSSSVGTRSNGEDEDHWLECRSRTLYTNTISVSFDFPNILHFYNTSIVLFGDCLENDCEVSWLGRRQETEVDCSLKIDGHQVLKPFNEQFLSIIQQFQTFQLDPPRSETSGHSSWRCHRGGWLEQAGGFVTAAGIRKWFCG